MASGAVQQFRLRWNNHQPNFISVFTSLLSKECLVDVTLGAEGKHVQAHKVVLSACSSYFQSLFTVNPCQHPIVLLKDVKYDDLKVIVDFMYYGEVNVSQEQLPAILKTAEMLKVKGLAEMPEQMSKSRSLSSDKGDDVPTPPGDNASVWGSDSVRHSPSPQPMSPAMRRKRLRKTSTGSGSGSTERTSERNSEEQSVDINMVKAEPMSFQSEGDSVRSNSSLRNSLQEASTESEPPDGLQEHVDEHNNMNSSQESTAGPIMDMKPGPSTAYHAGQGKIGTKRGRLLMRQSRIKKECESSQPLPHTSPDSEGPASPQPVNTPVRIERQSSDSAPCSSTQPSPPRSTSPGFQREIPFQHEGSREKLSTVTVSSSGGQQLTVPGVRIERQSSDPKLRTLSPTHLPSTPSMSLLSVPPGYLVKQHSHPNLPSHSSTPLVGHTLLVQRQHSQPSRPPPQHHLMSSLSFTSLDGEPPPSTASSLSVESGGISMSSSSSTPLLRLASDSTASLRVKSEEFRRSTSSPQPSAALDLGVGTSSGCAMEPARSGHCPVQRDGPALGCHFCWNTIDTHGRTLRRKTKYHCPECKTNLCIVPCFQEYHERQSKETLAASTSSIAPGMGRLLPKTSSI